MKIREIRVTFEVQEKIFKKHHVKREEVERAFFKQPYFFRTGKARYGCISESFITVIFTFHDGCADILTAYRSSPWQKKLYKRKISQ